MTPTSRRALAVAIVAGATVATVGAQVVVTPQNVSSALGSINRPMRAVASIRNTSTTTITVAVVKVTTPNCPASVVAAPLSGDLTLAPQEQVQIVFSTPGFDGSDVMLGTSCTFNIVQTVPSGPPPTTMQVNFSVTTMGAPIDPQSQVIDFRPPALTSETQSLLISNYSSVSQNGITATINEPTGHVTFAAGPCANLQTCALGNIAVNAAVDVPIKCDPQGQFVSGFVIYSGGTLGSGSGSGSTMPQSVTCGVGSGSGSNMPVPGHIKLDAASYTIVTQPSMLGSAFPQVSFDGDFDKLEAVSLTGSDAAYFSFPNLPCSPSCDFTGSELALPYTLAVGCTPDSATTRFAQVTVRGITSDSDTAVALLTCDPSAASNDPNLQVSTNVIDISGTVAVGFPSAPQPLTITNVGSGMLVAGIRIPAPFDQEWTVSSCTMAAPCTLVGNGSNTTVNITLTPDAHGDRSGSLVVESNAPVDPDESVTLVGSGSGGFLQVIDPSALAINFGTFPRAQQRSFVINLVDTGNVGLTVDVASPGAPFAANASQVFVQPGGGSASITTTCGPGSTFSGSGSYVLTSGAYNAPSISIQAACTLVDTAIEVAPLQFDFGELRLGEATRTRTFSIKNPTSTPVVIAGLAIANAPPVLGLVAPTTPVTLAQNATLEGTIELASTTETEIAGDVALAFTADGVELALPITGKVVHPHAIVEPVTLDLGTACIGSPVSGTVHLVNDGTATLTAQVPTMDQSFVTRFVAPSAYPATLPAAGTATIAIEPATSAAGSITGTLTWDVDVEGAPFTVPVDLEYIAAGTAVSPRRFDFATIEVGASSDRRVVTLENCNPEPLEVSVNGIVATQGGQDAWDIQPRTDRRTLLPHDTLKLSAAFVPKTRGTHRARIAIAAGGTAYDVELVGEALGEPDPTSFYACSCSGSRGVPAGGWPVGAALALACARRRRRTA